MDKIIIITHCDGDGYASGGIIDYFYESSNLDVNVEFFIMQHGDKLSYKPDNDTVFMTDFSLPKTEKMLNLKENSKEFILIDHHKTSIEKYKGLFKGLLRDGVAGCVLTWEYFFKGEEIPRGIKLLGQYDVWQNEDKDYWENEILPFQYYCKMMIESPRSLFLHDIFLGKVDYEECFKIGKEIIQYENVKNKQDMEKLSYELEWEGYRCLICNCDKNFNSFKSKFNSEKHDIMLAYKHSNKGFNVSCYSLKESGIDVTTISNFKGHACAAGMEVNSLPWL